MSKAQAEQKVETQGEQKVEAQMKGGDIEAGTAAGGEALYPKMVEDPRLRWAFIRKVYAILSAQFLFTAGVAAVITFVRPIPRFLLSHSPAAWAVYIAIIFLPLLLLWPMLRYRERHPVNLILLVIYTLAISVSIGLASASVNGRVVLQATILTATIVIGLTLYTFWAVKRGHDFSFLGPFLFASLLVLIAYLVIQLWFPLGKIGVTIYGCVASIVFSGFIIYDTNNLIKRHTYNDYIIAAISLYLDVVNLFMSMLMFSTAAD